MQATCQKCQQTITPKDFKVGRYFLFWITPTIPSQSLFLCQDCRDIPWPEREALFEAWMAQRQSSSHKPSRRKPSLFY